MEIMSEVTYQGDSMHAIIGRDLAVTDSTRCWLVMFIECGEL